MFTISLPPSLPQLRHTLQTTEQTTMHLAVGKTPGHTAVLTYLLTHRWLQANPNVKDKVRQAPVCVCVLRCVACKCMCV